MAILPRSLTSFSFHRVFSTSPSPSTSTSIPALQSSRWVSIAYRLSLSILIFLISLTLLAALSDLTTQLILSGRTSDVIISLAVYPLLAVIVLSMTISRTVSVRNALAAIPKTYLPVKSEDVPKAAFKLISNEYDRASVIAYISQPTGRTQAGWGRPGTEHEGVHFRTAILNTISVLQSVLSHLVPSNPLKSRSSPLSPFAPLLSSQPSVIPSALIPLAQLYEKHLQSARYGKDEPTEEVYVEVIKIVAVFVGILGRKLE